MRVCVRVCARLAPTAVTVVAVAAAASETRAISAPLTTATTTIHHPPHAPIPSLHSRRVRMTTTANGGALPARSDSGYAVRHIIQSHGNSSSRYAYSNVKPDLMR